MNTSTPSFSGSQRPDLWRINPACSTLGISRGSLYKLVKNGELRLIRIAGRSLIPDSEIRRLRGDGA